MSISLRSLSDNDILSRTRALIAKERTSTLLLLTHLNEIERRRLHLKLGYQSMFDYCTSGLGYSASAAMRRIRTARCIVRFPEVYELLESSEVNLSTISQVSRVLTPENKDRVLERIRGRSQREVEAIVAEYDPRASIPPDRVRTVVMSVAVGMTPALVKENEAQNAASPDCRTGESHNRSGCGREDPPDARHNRSGCAFEAPAGQTACTASVTGTAKLERRALIQFSASEAFMAKVEQVRSLAWHRLPSNASFEQVFELALDLVIERKDPRKHSERREARERSARSRETTAAAVPVSQEPCRQTDATRRARYIPAPVRDQVFTRDKGQCSYAGSNGRRCASTRALQVDHITPVARGGAGTSDNLRLLCAYHNRLEAERVMGRHGVRDGPSPR